VLQVTAYTFEENLIFNLSNKLQLSIIRIHCSNIDIKKINENNSLNQKLSLKEYKMKLIILNK